MKNFKIVPLSAEFANTIRRSKKDQSGHEVIEQTATGHGPCRVALKPFKPGKTEGYYLATARLKLTMLLTSRGQFSSLLRR